MGAISATDIISISQSEIENFDFDTESRETGEVIYVGDGIATIYGIDPVSYTHLDVYKRQGYRNRINTGISGAHSILQRTTWRGNRAV